MRKIKFRAWDYINELMFIPTNIDLDNYYEKDKKHKYLATHQHSQVSCDCTQKECILMQYTGLKDKNCKEIYEGDIIKD